VIYLDLEDLLHVAERTLGEVQVHDLGLLQAAVARPRASAFGQDAYGSLHHKAAALLHSIARNHALVDGNKRLSLAAAIAFYGMNGYRLTLTDDQAYDLIISVATGELGEVDATARLLEASVAEWPG
jgi:death-on-curing protein